jgi:hypothetical protein
MSVAGAAMNLTKSIRLIMKNRIVLSLLLIAGWMPLPIQAADALNPFTPPNFPRQSFRTKLTM